MFKKSLLIMMLMALFAPWAANGQETKTVNAGTRTDYTIPFDGNYHDRYTKVEWITHADSIAVMEGASITGIKFYVQEVPTYGSGWSSNIQIFMKEVSNPYLGNSPYYEGPTGATIVYDNTLTHPTTTGEFEIQFSTPYEYQGGHLLIGIYNTTKGGYKKIVFYGKTSDEETQQSVTGNNASSLNSVSGNRSWFVPKTTFVYTPGSSDCPKPKNPTIADVTFDGATFGWTAGTNYTGTYDVAISTISADEPQNNEIVATEVAGTSYGFEDLTPGTTYYAYVRAHCGSDWVKKDFNTDFACSAPTNLGHNALTSNSATLSWTNGGTETSWNLRYKTASSDWTTLSTPITKTNDVYVLEGLVSHTGYTWQVQAICPGEGNGTSDWSAEDTFTTECGTVSITPTAYQYGFEDAAEFDCWTMNNCYTSYGNTGIYGYAYNTGSQCFRFYYSSTYNPQTIITPQLSTTSNGVRVEFYHRASSSSGYDQLLKVAYSTTNNDINSFNWDNAVEISVNSTSFKSFKCDFPYANIKYVAIQYDRNGKNYSTYIDDITISNAPSCLAPQDLTAGTINMHTAGLSWTKVGAATSWDICYSTTSGDRTTMINVTEDDVTIEESTVTYTLGDNDGVALAGNTKYYVSVRSHCSDSDQSEWSNEVNFTTLVSCEATASAPTLSDIDPYSATATWTDENHNAWLLCYATTSTTPGVGITETTDTYTVISCDDKTADLTSLTPNTTYYAWVRSDCGAIDGMSAWSSRASFSTPATCIKPGTPSCSSTTATTAILSWAKGAETQEEWEVSFSTTNSVNLDNIRTATTNTNFELTGLTPNTSYYAWVRAVCSENDKSEWSSASSQFTTPCSSITTFPYNQPFSITSGIPQCWNNSEGTTTTNSYKWNYYSSGYLGACVRFNSSSNPKNCDNYLKTPEIELPDDRAMQLSFWYKSNTYPAQGSEYRVYISVDGNSEKIELTDNLAGTSSWTQMSPISLKAYKGHTVVISFYGKSDYYSGYHWLDDVLIEEAPCCPAPENLTVVENSETTSSAQLIWTVQGDETAWQIAYTTDASIDPDQIANPVTANANPFTLSVPNEGTTYYAYVRAVCPDGCDDDQSDWSNKVSFTTLESCPTPVITGVSNILHTSATIAWTGSNDSYTLSYGTSDSENVTTILDENFDNETIPSDWTQSATYPWAIVAHGEGFCMQSSNQGVGGSKSSISCTATFATNGHISFDAQCMGEGSGSMIWDKSTFYIDNEAMFTKGANGEQWDSYNFDVTPGTHTFKWEYSKDNNGDENGDAFSVDNVIITAESIIWATPITGITEQSYTLNNLTAMRTYYVQVQGVCGDASSNPSETATFTTMDNNIKVFVTEGNWNVAGNWDGGIPSLTDNVVLNANVTITGTAEANQITQNSMTITIEDGGQLKTSTAVTATVKKTIDAYPTNVEKAGYYLIASPMASTIYNFSGTGTPRAEGLITDDNNDPSNLTYDFYKWDFTQQDEEWRNNRKSSIYPVNGTGYLYASKNGTELSFVGQVMANNADVTKTPTYGLGDYEFKGWWLMGNPFVCNAYINEANTNLAFYRMNPDGNGFITATGAIAPMEGVFVQCTASNQTFKFSRTQTDGSRELLNINLSTAFTHNTNVTDRAIVRFGEGNTLEKFSFREGSTKVYIPQDGKDYAVVNAGKVGELPVNFKAEKNGTYTLNFTSKEVTFSYLHLIDNMNGNDVDLLANPSYSFEARTTDYESRFRLVFATGSSVDGDNFAFINGAGNLSIFGIEGEATVQVIDVLGHVLSSEQFSGSYEKKINGAPGVYMVRLLNGNDVKVQKVVVRR